MRNRLERLIVADSDSPSWDFARAVHRCLVEIEARKKFEIDFMLAGVKIEQFPDGEFEPMIEENCRGRHVIFIHDASKEASRYWAELMLINDAARRGSAERVVDVLPYMRWSRGEKKDKSHTPISTKVFLDTISNPNLGSRTDRLIVSDLHASAVQGFVNIPVDALPSFPYVCENILDYFNCIDVVAGPDIGSSRRVDRAIKSVKNCLERQGIEREIGLVLVDKKRLDGSRVETREVIGNVRGKNVLLVDDILSSASTLKGARDALLKGGAERVIAYATHFVGAGNYAENLKDFEMVYTANSFHQPKKRVPENVRVLDVSPLVAKAIYEAERGGSISKLYE